jgi:3'-5' exoribonuclease
MPSQRTNQPIRSWLEGDSVSGFALLTRKERRQDKNGRDFLDMQLADASGSIAAKVWSDNPALDGEFEAHQFVAFRGQVKRYRDQLQITVLDCRQATEADRSRGFDESTLIPSTSQSIEELWGRLEKLLDENLERPVLRSLAEETLEAHGEALREHPAAKAIHHAYRGGLLEHVVSMAELALRFCDHYPELDRDLILIGVLFHDLGKIVELGAMPANDYTVEGRLVGHVVIGRDLLRDRCRAIPDFPADLLLALEHLVLSHQGELAFGSPVEPRTAEAFALHFLDNLDSKLNQLRVAREGGVELVWIPSLQRHVYLPGAGEQQPGEDEEGDEAQTRLDL